MKADPALKQVLKIVDGIECLPTRIDTIFYLDEFVNRVYRIGERTHFGLWHATRYLNNAGLHGITDKGIMARLETMVANNLLDSNGAYSSRSKEFYATTVVDTKQKYPDVDPLGVLMEQYQWLNDNDIPVPSDLLYYFGLEKLDLNTHLENFGKIYEHISSHDKYHQKNIPHAYGAPAVVPGQFFYHSYEGQWRLGIFLGYTHDDPQIIKNDQFIKFYSKHTKFRVFDPDLGRVVKYYLKKPVPMVAPNSMFKNS